MCHNVNMMQWLNIIPLVESTLLLKVWASGAISRLLLWRHLDVRFHFRDRLERQISPSARCDRRGGVFCSCAARLSLSLCCAIPSTRSHQLEPVHLSLWSVSSLDGTAYLCVATFHLMNDTLVPMDSLPHTKVTSTLRWKSPIFP